MKKLVAILFLAASTICVAQESVKLRLKYAKGDAYNVEISQNVSSPQMVMDMKMTSRLDVTEVDGDVYSSEKKITKIVMPTSSGKSCGSSPRAAHTAAAAHQHQPVPRPPRAQ